MVVADTAGRPASAARVPEALYPFASHWHDRGDGIRMHYLDEGPKGADPVVMVHGNPTWSFYYRNLVTALSGTNRCLVPDHVGCGFSDKPDDAHYRYTLQSRVDDLEGWLDAVGIPRPAEWPTPAQPAPVAPAEASA